MLYEKQSGDKLALLPDARPCTFSQTAGNVPLPVFTFSNVTFLQGDSGSGRALAGVGSASLAALHALEAAERRLHPPDLPRLRGHLAPLAARSKEALRAFRAAAVPEGLADFHDHLSEAAERTEEALAAFLDAPPAPRAMIC